MAGYLSKLEKNLLKKFDVVVKTTGNGTTNEVVVTHPHRILDYDGSVKTGTGTTVFYIDKSPTGNCQMSSIRAFYNQLCQWLAGDVKIGTKITGSNDIIHFNHRMHQLAFLKGMAYYVKKYGGKKLYFIDIKQTYIPGLDNVNKYLFTKRNKMSDHKYISTNTSRMMYTVLRVDEGKLNEYL